MLQFLLNYFSGNLLSDIVLINSGIWRGISAALKVVCVGYLNFVCFLSWYLLVSRFSLAYFRTICFFALVETRVVKFYFCDLCVAVSSLRFVGLTIFLFVSVILVGLSDRLAGLLNRTW